MDQENKINNIYVKEELKKLESIPFTGNKNYLDVISKIPKYFHFKNKIFESMLVSFNYGVSVGRKCEKDKIKWNANAVFFNMSYYAKVHNGQLPNTLKELQTWVHEYINS